MKVDFDQGSATVWPAEGEGFDPRGLRNAVGEAGFAVPEVTLIVVGKLVSRNDDRFLEPRGSALSYFLSAEGEAFEALQQEGLLGQRLRLTGHLLMQDTDRSPSLAVTAWEAADENPKPSDRTD